MIWHSTSSNEVLNELQVDDKRGLSNGEVELRLDRYGKNVISKIEVPTFLQRLKEQLKSRVVIALIIVAIITFIVSLIYKQENAFYSLLMLVIVLINALISTYHINRCDKALDSVKQFAKPVATVLRDGIVKKISSFDLVPGDIILLEEGDYISADARIIDSTEFRCNEAEITGDDIPVEKNADEIFDDIETVENRKNMVFSGTSVAHGNAKAVVVATAFNTEIGKNSAISQQVGNDDLPVKRELDFISKIVNIFIFLICALVFVIGFVQNFSTSNFSMMTLKVLLDTLALAVAAIPEGLPIISTLVIAIGIQTILKQNIVLKDASALELLGKADIICSDKTGVITRNKMNLSRIFDGTNLIDLEKDVLTENAANIIKFAAACSTLQNDSTESAIQKACLNYNSMSKRDIDALFPKLAEIPFESERKTMTVITMINETPVAIVKGAPEIVIPKCVGVNAEQLLKLNDEFASDALRNICIAVRKLDNIPANPLSEEIEKDLKFIGLLGLSHPIRDGIEEQIDTCKHAGIKTVMITGDNLLTAKVIAKKVGILLSDEAAITGEELAKMSDKDLEKNIHKYSVFARVFPEDKLRIVKAFQKRKKIVVVTGYNLDDADALNQADVGCAIGKFGSDVAKTSADIVISNNRFDSIVTSIRESRGLFSNIKKSVYYLLSCNLGELIAMVLGMLIFKNPPLLAVQLLWINLLTDSAPTISLSMEQSETKIMKRKSFFSNYKVLDVRALISLAVQSFFIAGITLTSFATGYTSSYTNGYEIGVTMAFATLAISQILHCFNNKFEGTIINKSIFSNKFMNYSVLITLFITMFLVLTPAGNLFGLTVLKFSDLFKAFLLGFLIIPFSELLKFIRSKI